MTSHNVGMLYLAVHWREPIFGYSAQVYDAKQNRSSPVLELPRLPNTILSHIMMQYHHLQQEMCESMNLLNCGAAAS